MAALIVAVAGDKFSLIHTSRASPVISIAAAASSAAASIRGLRHGLTIAYKICDGSPLAALALFRGGANPSVPALGSALGEM